MSYDQDEESGDHSSEGRFSERYSTASSVMNEYEIKLNNIATELKLVSNKFNKKLKNYQKNRDQVLHLYSNMVEFTQTMNETLVKAQNLPESGFKENAVNVMRWKNICIKYTKNIKSLESIIFQKQRELDKLNLVKNKKYSPDNQMEEMQSLIEPEYAGEEEENMLGLKQRRKDTVYGEDFKLFMKRRSQRIAKITESMEKINVLYNDLNDLANDQEEHLNLLDHNIDEAVSKTKQANKQLKKSKPKSLCNYRLVVATLVLALVVMFFISHYLIRPSLQSSNISD